MEDILQQHFYDGKNIKMAVFCCTYFLYSYDILPYMEQCQMLVSVIGNAAETTECYI